MPEAPPKQSLAIQKPFLAHLTLQSDARDSQKRALAATPKDLAPVTAKIGKVAASTKACACFDDANLPQFRSKLLQRKVTISPSKITLESRTSAYDVAQENFHVRSQI